MTILRKCYHLKPITLNSVGKFHEVKEDHKCVKYYQKLSQPNPQLLPGLQNFSFSCLFYSDK